MLIFYTCSILAAILAQSFFAASEMAFTSINRLKLKGLVDSGDSAAGELDRFLHKEDIYLSATLVGTNISVVISSVLATRIFAEYFPPSAAPFLATAVMVPTTLVFAEIVPKMIARQLSMPFALKALRPLKGFYGIFRPLVASVNAVAGVMLLPFGKKTSSVEPAFTRGDLKTMLSLGFETGEVEADEIELIHRVMDFGAKRVAKIMVPLYRVSSLSIDDTVGDLKRLVSLTGFSRIPVYESNKSNIVGIVNIYDILFDMEGAAEGAGLRKYVREPVHVGREDTLDITLTRLRNRKQPMGIVAGRDKAVAGIVTIEDMLEEIVGEIEDTRWRE